VRRLTYSRHLKSLSGTTGDVICAGSGSAEQRYIRIPWLRRLTI
jgi:hypothetical protein